MAVQLCEVKSTAEQNSENRNKSGHNVVTVNIRFMKYFKLLLNTEIMIKD